MVRRPSANTRFLLRTTLVCISFNYAFNPANSVDKKPADSALCVMCTTRCQRIHYTAMQTTFAAQQVPLHYSYHGATGKQNIKWNQQMSVYLKIKGQ